MSVEDEGTIDIISLEDKTGEVVLTITDHLDWSDTRQHQFALQKKLNTYLAFVESGEILEQYPRAKGHPVAFEISLKFKPDYEGRKFLNRVREVIEHAGFRVRCEIFAESYDN